MISRRVLAALSTPNSEGTQNGNIIRPTEEKSSKIHPLQASSAGRAVGKRFTRSKSESSLHARPAKKARLDVNGQEKNGVPFTVHEDEEDLMSKKPSVIPSPVKIALQSYTISLEPVSPIASSSAVDAADEQVQWITSANPSDSYYKVLAEQCQAALKETLEENKKLRDRIDALERENAHLYDVGSQAEYFANIIKEQMEREESRVDVGTQTRD